jgi:hypothetical protein
VEEAPEAAAEEAPPEAHAEAPRRGATAFVRRLEAGADLAALLADVEEGGVAAARFRDRYERLRPLLLHADGEPAKGESPAQTLCRLTVPRRDLTSLILAGRTPKDPLGAAMDIRIWTRGAPHPEDEVARVSATIRHILGPSGRTPGGIDVLVTRGMGYDVFPDQTRVGAAGVYFLEDRYCVVYSRLSPVLRTEVIEHECIHALHHALPDCTKSSFIHEGLAEYLRLVEPGSKGLDVPRDRLADACADLQFMLARLNRAGVGTACITPARLVDLEPREFYALRHLGYLLAQVTMACVGGETIHLALQSGSDARIVEAARCLGWPELLQFIGEEARGGRRGRATVVQDMPYEPGWLDRDVFLNALRAIGSDLPERTTAIRTELAGGPPVEGLEAGLEPFLGQLVESSWVPRVCVDLSPAMDRPIRLRPTPKGVVALLGAEPRGDTPRGFARTFLAALATDRAFAVQGLCKDRRSGGLEVLDGVEALDLQPLEHGPTPAALIVVVGAPDVGHRLPALRGGLGRAILVVDLTEDGAGLALAQAWGESRPSAYWRPLAE